MGLAPSARADHPDGLAQRRLARRTLECDGTQGGYVYVVFLRWGICSVAEQTVLEGRLAGFENGRVRLDLGERGLQELDLNDIRKAQLVVEL